MTRAAPDAEALAAAFGLGRAISPPEWRATGWGGHNVLWQLTTSQGRWAIKEVRHDLSLDPDETLAVELAAYAGGVPMPRPIPSRGGRCFAVLEGQRYRCHEWVDGRALPGTDMRPRPPLPSVASSPGFTQGHCPGRRGWHPNALARASADGLRSPTVRERPA